MQALRAASRKKEELTPRASSRRLLAGFPVRVLVLYLLVCFLLVGLGLLRLLELFLAGRTDLSDMLFQAIVDLLAGRFRVLAELCLFFLAGIFGESHAGGGRYQESDHD